MINKPTNFSNYLEWFIKSYNYLILHNSCIYYLKSVCIKPPRQKRLFVDISCTYFFFTHSINIWPLVFLFKIN